MSKVDIRDAFFDEIYNIASSDKDVIFITADADAFSLKKFKEDLPDQFINVGVAEQNMVLIAAGLALSGKKVFIYAIIPFITMRCYEHIKTNICGMNLPITIVGAGAGLSFGNDGPTHHAIHDIAVIRILPNITILNPSDSLSASSCAHMAYKSNGPVYVRFDKGILPKLYNSNDEFEEGFKVIRKISDINIVSTGLMTHKAVEVADHLCRSSINVGVIDLYRIKPVDKDALLKLIGSSKQLVTLEENSIVGGIGTIMSEILVDAQKTISFKRIALADTEYFDYGTRSWLHKKCGLDIDGISARIAEQ